MIVDVQAFIKLLGVTDICARRCTGVLCDGSAKAWVSGLLSRAHTSCTSVEGVRALSRVAGRVSSQSVEVVGLLTTPLTCAAGGRKDTVRHASNVVRAMKMTWI